MQLIPSNNPELEDLHHLLAQRQATPKNIASIDAEICNRFLKTLAVLTLDMQGFSHLTQTQGIIPALQIISRLQAISISTFEECGGTLFKTNTNNVYASFHDSDQALNSAEVVLARLNTVDLHAGIGIGYGDLLVIGDYDIYGHEMNLASKLGEDLAEKDEILLTEAACKNLSKSPRLFEASTQAISGTAFHFYRLI
ncbi:MAG: adenylate/guanylate cyclase domain-containing protein [Cyanobacteria bacterium J06636_16]